MQDGPPRNRSSRAQVLVTAAHLTRYCRERAHFSPDSCGTNRTGQQISHPDQIVRRRCERENPTYLVNPPMRHLAHQCDRLQPPEALFDSLPLLLADPISGVPRGPLVNGAAATPLGVLCRSVHPAAVEGSGRSTGLRNTPKHLVRSSSLKLLWVGRPENVDDTTAC